MPQIENKDSPLERYISLLEVIAPHADGLTSQEIERALGIPKATTNRLVHVLMNSGLVTPSAARARAYKLGPRILNLLHGAGDTSWIERLTEKSLQKLANETGQSAFLCRRNGAEVVSLNCASPDTSVRFHIAPGTLMPLNAAATAKAIWAHQATADIEAVIQSSLERFTEQTITSATALREELLQVKTQGYAIENGEHVHGLASLAVPIRSADGSVSYALGLTGAQQVMLAERQGNLAAMTIAAQALAQTLNIPAP